MIKQARKAKGLKIVDIAAALHCSRSALYSIERKQTGGELLGKYCELLGFKSADITRIRTGLHSQMDIED